MSSSQAYFSTLATKHTDSRRYFKGLPSPVILVLSFSLLTSVLLDLKAQQPQPAIPTSPAAIATNEVLRRQHMLAEANKLIQAGSLAQTDRSYAEAMDNFKAAFELLPEAPAVAATRRAVFRRYQAATVQFAQQMIDEGRWQWARQALEDSVKLGSEAGFGSLMDPGLQRMLANLDDPEYYTTAIGPDHIQDVQKVKQLLITAQGYLDYGDYDRAARTYNQVLFIDRYNSAARRGIENVERHKMNYFDVARDQTRATMLREVAEGWEMPVPRTTGADIVLENQKSPFDGRQLIQEKLKSIIIPSIELDEASLRDVINLLVQQSQALDFAESNINLKGINLILDTGSFGAGEDPGSKTLSIRISNSPLGVVLKYVTQLTGTAYQVDNTAVRIVSRAATAQTVLDNRVWTVPPGFLARDGLGNDVQINADPFADAGADQGVGGSVLVARKSAKEFLEESGVVFGEGASASYNAGTSTLLVRNTPEQLALIDGLVQAAREGVSKMVEIGVKMISISQEKVKQLGADTLLGQFNVGSSERVFAGGGTNGATTPAQFPFGNPGTATAVGVFPLTAGLRTDNLQATQSIEDVIARQLGDTANPASPSVFTVAGVFTDPQFQTTLKMFTQTKGVDFLCDTKLLIRPGQRGKIESVREFIYPTEYDPPEIPNDTRTNLIATLLPTDTLTDSPAPITPATPTAFEMRPLGKILEVEATVAEDNYTVNLDLLLDMSEFVGFINYGSPISVQGTVTGGSAAAAALAPPPQTNSTPNRILMPVFDAIKEATNVTVWDGQTVIIGGLHGHSVTDVQDKVPFLGDLPVLGRMFRTNTEDHKKNALFIFATVRLIDPGGVPLNNNLDDNDANEFPPRSGRPPTPPVAPLGPPSMPYQK